MEKSKQKKEFNKKINISKTNLQIKKKIKIILQDWSNKLTNLDTKKLDKITLNHQNMYTKINTWYINQNL